jgi:hypothetical protein
MTDEPRFPTPEEVETEVLDLIPEAHQVYGITVEVSRPDLVEQHGQMARAEGHDVYLRVGEDRVRVGPGALSDTLADWHSRRTGWLPTMVRAAVTELVRRRDRGGDW